VKYDFVKKITWFGYLGTSYEEKRIDQVSLPPIKYEEEFY
jgi:hypothetical protein